MTGPSRGRSQSELVEKRKALRASFRQFEDAPVGIFVVHGPTHSIVYGNRCFQLAAGMEGAAIGESLRNVLAGASAKSLGVPEVDELVAVLDRVRTAQGETGIVSLNANVVARDFPDASVNVSLRSSVALGAHDANGGSWRCMAWPVRGARGKMDEVVVELWHVPEELSALVRQREIAERMLLSALREQTLSDENALLYESANSARAVATAAQRSAEQAQLRAERAQHDAEAANLAKAQFLANMSHELRTPLNAIGGYAQLIEMGLRGAVTDAQLTDLARIRRSQTHLLGLINAVLNYAKLEAGRVEYALENLSLAALVVDAELLVDPQLHAKGLHYEYSETTHSPDGAPVNPPRVNADPQKLTQIVLNLLMNAIKYTASGGTITVACHSVGNVASVTVSDTGRGIPANRLGAVFEPFVQLGNGLSSGDPGVGLGLAISRDLAKGMDGDLTVQSVEGKGSTFTLSLPLAA